MPAVLDDPHTPTVYRTSGEPPYPTPYAPPPADVVPRTVTLRDRQTNTTLIPFTSPESVPKKLTAYLCALMNREIEQGDTYPMIEEFTVDRFAPYWFGNFGVVMFLGEIEDGQQIWRMEQEGADWSKLCLGSFYIKPNYPGRSSHVCNGGFLVSDKARGRGVGRLMGECYLEYAPRLGYTYSIFNLVYETNVASVRIWDALGFKRVGKVKGCGNLKSYPDRLVDAIIFGRDLHVEPEEYLQEERFDKIRFYLKTNQYPTGADRAEKSRLRSASAHYRIIPATDDEEEKLMLKDKEVVSDPNKQYEIAFKVHSQYHGGINKTTATIAEKYHWVRIKETVSAAIRNCTECKEAASRPAKAAKTEHSPIEQGLEQKIPSADDRGNVTASAATLQAASVPQQPTHQVPVGSLNPNIHPDPQEQQPMPMADMQAYDYHMQLPVDPQIMEGIRQQAVAEQQFANHAVAQHQMHAYATPQQHFDMQAYAHHDPTMVHHEYGMHHPHVSAGADQQAYVDHGVDDAQLQEQLRRDMGAQYRHQQGGP